MPKNKSDKKIVLKVVSGCNKQFFSAAAFEWVNFQRQWTASQQSIVVLAAK